jgi:cytochrome c556
MKTPHTLGLVALSLSLTAWAANSWAQADTYAVSKRKAVAVSAVEHAHLLTEMNAFMDTIHGINTALSEKDFAKVATLAKAMGPKGGQHDAVGEALHKALPDDWFALAKPTHQKFLAIAQEAQQANPQVDRVLAQVAATTQQCVACHATFRLEVKR